MADNRGQPPASAHGDGGDESPDPGNTGPEAGESLLSALVTEHFVLQSVRSTGTSESGGRTSLYLATLSSAMIALGFVSPDAATFRTFLVAVLPIVLIVGAVTFLRLVDLGVQDLRRLQDIEHVKDFYRTLSPRAAEFFPPLEWHDARALIVSQNMRAGPLQLLSTSAAMVAVINSAVAGIAGALLVGLVAPDAVAIGSGILIAVAGAGASMRYQWAMNVRAFD